MLGLLARLVKEAHLVYILARVLLETGFIELLPLTLNPEIFRVKELRKVTLGILFLPLCLPEIFLRILVSLMSLG